MGHVSFRARPLRRALIGVLGLVLAVGTQLAAPAQPASATGSLVSTPTTTVFAQLNTTTALAGMAISGDTTSTLQATLSTTSGTLSISSPPTGVTLAYGNSWTGSSSITFSGLESAINTTLGTASLVAGSTTSTASVSLTAMVLQSGYDYLAANQHFYRYVASSGISWTAADAAAKVSNYAGQPGYLATIPSSSVNDFIRTKIASATNIWFGARAYESTATDGTASLATVASTTYPRVWRWVAGSDESPIAGQVITTCTALTNSGGCTTPGGSYSSWNTSSGEPNNSGGTSTAYSGEYVGVTNWNGTSGAWNDLPISSSSVSGYVVEYGGKTNSDASLGTGFSGVVTSSTNVSIAAAATAPSAPTITAVAGNASAVTTWNPPADGGSPITSYQYSVDGGAWTTFTPTVSSAVVNGNTVITDTATVPGLTNGSSASIRVLAINSVGSGTASNTVSVTPKTVPDAPTAVVATRGNSSASVAFVVPGSNGGSAITGYTATSTPGGLTGTCSSSPCSVTGLTNGTAYTFTVHATNTVGDGAESTSSAAVTPATVPGTPSGITPTPSDSSVSVAFTAPASNGAAISSYLVTASPGGATAICSTSPCSVTGLTNGTAYTFTVRATNAAGNGPTSSASSAATPSTVPGVPTSVVATRGNASASVAFTAPSSTGGVSITSYTATATPGGATASCSSSPCAVTGLTNGTAYTFTVHATNADGSGAESASSSAVTPATVPGVPTSVTATRGNTSASVSFTAPAANGSAITGYTVTTQPGGVTTSCSASPCTVTGLTNGSSYTFTVLATNAVGDGSASASSAGVTPATLPAAPTSVVATRGDTSASVAFVAPGLTGGSAITGYTATASPGGASATCSSSPCTVTGLTNGTAYTFTVHATNALGDSVESAASSLITPATVPGTPTGLLVTPADTAVSVAFTAPADHGAAITSYRVTASPGGATTTCATSPCAVLGLTNGTPYTFTVRATNGIGDGGTSAPSAAAVPATVPGAPTSVVATRGDSSALVAFVAPVSTGGSAISSYAATANPGGASATCTTSPCLVTGLTNGTSYTFTVAATNAVSVGPSSSPPSAAVVPARPPNAPTSVLAAAGDTSASVAFATPADNGSPITGYTMTTLPGGATTSCSASPCTITGLTNGTAYTFAVRSSNAVGAGSDSVASTPVVPATLPGAPTGLIATRGGGQATVDFAAPAGNGGSAIIRYRVTSSPGGATTTCTAGPCTVTGLTNGVTYTLQVHAVNAVGDGPDASSPAVTPASVPGAPTGVRATALDGAVAVSWTTPADSGGDSITGYRVTVSPTGATLACAASPCTVPGLVNGRAVTVRVVASNSVGDSARSAASTEATPAGVPATPTGFSASVGDGTVQLEFDAPSDNGAAISGYEISLDQGATWRQATYSGTARVRITLTGLDNGTTVDIQVRAVSAAGAGSGAGPGSARPVAPPVAPRILGVLAGDRSASVSWTAPSSTGGVPLTGYTVTATPGGRSCSTDGATGCVVRGLTNGLRYSFTVRATTGLGSSVESAAVAATPVSLPDAPTGVRATGRAGAAIVTFTAPADTGGSAITGYVLRSAVPDQRCAASPCRVDGLTNGTAYRFRVAAVTRVGTGPAAAADAAVVPADRPGAPTGLVVTANDGSVDIAFRAPADRGSDITGYLVSTDGGATWNALDVALGSTVRATIDAPNGVPVGVAVRAVNGVGAGTPVSAAYSVPVTTPAAPIGVRVTLGDGSATVEFAEPDDGGAAVSSYVVVVSPGGRRVTCTSSPCTIDGLTNGDHYTFKVSAKNTAGTGAVVRTPRSVVPQAEPIALPPPTVRLQRTSVDVSWAASSSSAVKGYRAHAWPGGASCTPVPATATHCTITGLTPGKVYAFTVSVKATGGRSSTSPQSRSIALDSAVDVVAAPSLLSTPAAWVAAGAVALGALFLVVAWLRRRRRDQEA